MEVTVRQDRGVSAAMEVLEGRRSIKKCRAQTNMRSRLTTPSLCIFSERTRSFPPVSSSENELAKVAESGGCLRPPRARGAGAWCVRLGFESADAWPPWQPSPLQHLMRCRSQAWWKATERDEKLRVRTRACLWLRHSVQCTHFI